MEGFQRYQFKEIEENSRIRKTRDLETLVRIWKSKHKIHLCYSETSRKKVV